MGIIGTKVGFKNSLYDLMGAFTSNMNDPTTRDNVVKLFHAFLDEKIDDGSIEAYSVDCSEDNNTPERIEANQLWVDASVRFAGQDDFEDYTLCLSPSPSRVFYLDDGDLPAEEVSVTLAHIKEEIDTREITS